MTWFRTEARWWSHPKTYELARLLGVELEAAAMAISKVWSYAAEHHPDGDLSHVQLEAFHRYVGWTSSGLSFGRAVDSPHAVLTMDRTDLRSVLAAAGFIDQENDGQFVLHDWYDRNGKLHERRLKDRERKQLARTNRPQDKGRTVRRTSAGRPHTRDVTVRSTSPTPPAAEAAGPPDTGRAPSALEKLRA